MIPANELRIGNWALYDDGTNRAYITPTHISEIEKGELTILPIPLTPEILLACGFKKDTDDCLSLNKIFYWLGFVQIAIGYAPLINLQHLKYLHQLQNLYFSFYNKELEYRP